MEYITEAEAIGDYDNCLVEHDIDLEDVYSCQQAEERYDRFKEKREKSIQSDYEHYLDNKTAKVGETIICAENRCKKKFVKKSYQQAFCCTKHKNQFWNRQRL
jgi:hypothetical protein